MRTWAALVLALLLPLAGCMGSTPQASTDDATSPTPSSSSPPSPSASPSPTHGSPPAGSGGQPNQTSGPPPANQTQPPPPGSPAGNQTPPAGSTTPSAPPPPPSPYEPHVVVAVPDSGFNPYHSVYHRPERTEHPCTYIQDFPCSVQALPLSVGGNDWNAAFSADAALWNSVRPDVWYWIPKTVFVAVSCNGGWDPEEVGMCLLDDTDMHGTGTTSSVLMENPDALIAFREGGPSVLAFAQAGIPVDVYSVSWGYTVPIPVLPNEAGPVYVTSSGNDPRSTLVDGWAGDPRVISVGGGYAEDRSEEAVAGKNPDVVSYYCRPTAQTESTHAMRPSYCGTSFAAPTVSGALSWVILELRRQSGYTGSVEGGFVDPVLGVTTKDLRDALNRTATYAPAAKYSNTALTGIPLDTSRPWIQWGWGFYDGDIAKATLAHLTGQAPAPEKPTAAKDWMATVYEARQLTHPS